MGVFFTKPSIASIVRPRLITAYRAELQDADVAGTSADTAMTAITHAARPQFSVARALIALAFVIVLFGLYFWSAHDAKMATHSDELFHLFVILTTGLIGLLVGETASAGT